MGGPRPRALYRGEKARAKVLYKGRWGWRTFYDGDPSCERTHMTESSTFAILLAGFNNQQKSYFLTRYSVLFFAQTLVIDKSYLRKLIEMYFVNV